MQHWIQKFRNAFRGIYFGCRGESSFLVHTIVGMAVVLAAIALRCEPWQWCILLLCITLVMSLELLNSGLEHLARAVCRDQNEDVGRALDIASGAVLCASLFAAIMGVVILGGRLLSLIN